MRKLKRLFFSIVIGVFIYAGFLSFFHQEGKIPIPQLEYEAEEVKNEMEEEAKKEKKNNNKLTTIDNEEDIYPYIEKELEKGKEKITFYMSSDYIADDIFEDINHKIDVYFGKVINYETDSVLDEDNEKYQKITLYANIQDEYYAERYLLEGEEIPEDMEEAQAISDKATEILDALSLDEDTAYQKEKKIHDYLVDNVTYTKKDSSNEHAAYKALIEGECVCDGYSRAMKLLCDLSDVECKLIRGTSKGNHMWNMVKLDGNWYHLDVTFDDKEESGFEDGYYAYFNNTDDMISFNHKWNTGRYPHADCYDYNYYVINNSFVAKEDLYDYLLEKANEGADNFELYVENASKEDFSKDNLSYLFDESNLQHYHYTSSNKGDNIVLNMEFDY